MAEGGVEKRALQAVLGVEEDGLSTSGTFNIVVKDHGVKSGIQYDSVCITPVVDIDDDDVPDKTVQVLCTQDTELQGGLKFSTVSVCETPREVTSENTVSKIVHLRSSKAARTARASDAKAGAATGTLSDEDSEGIFASDPEAFKCIRLIAPKPAAAATSASCTDEQDGIFASDPEALKYVRFGPKPAAAATGASCTDEQDGIFASDPEALKYVRFGPKPEATTGASEEHNGVFASDPEALRCIRFGPKSGGNRAACTDEDDGIFVSDPEALKYIRFGPKTGASCAPEANKPLVPSPESSMVSNYPAADGEGDLLAEATSIQLQDNRSYSVQVSGHALPDGLHKKFISVRRSDCGDEGPTPLEVENLQVTVETKVSEEGLVEKFIAVE